jgi:hypothetical protein
MYNYSKNTTAVIVKEVSISISLGFQHFNESSFKKTVKQPAPKLYLVWSWYNFLDFIEGISFLHKFVSFWY